jgi:hypothetical protein
MLSILVFTQRLSEFSFSRLVLSISVRQKASSKEGMTFGMTARISYDAKLVTSAVRGLFLWLLKN